MRLGYENEFEFINLMPVLNNYPLEEIILHPRIGKQLYKGNLYLNEFETFHLQTKHRLVYNGDINDRADYLRLKTIFPHTDHWMIGRGILHDIFLIERIKNMEINNTNRTKFYDEIYYQITKHLQQEHAILQKLKEFWFYFSSNYENKENIFKKIKKAKTMEEYNLLVNQLVFD